MASRLTLSIIIPVLNEAGNINTLIRRLPPLPSDGTREVIVVDGDPAGSTIRALSDPRVKTAIAGPGRAAQMNHGASLASGAVLLFLHADTRLPEQGLRLVAETMESGRYVGGAFDLGFDTKRKIFSITERYVALRTRLTRVPFGDQALFISKPYFERIGGFRNIPIMEDVELMNRIRRLRGKIRIIPEKVRTSPRRYEREGILYATLRNLALQMLYALGVSPVRLAKWYRANQP